MSIHNSLHVDCDHGSSQCGCYCIVCQNREKGPKKAPQQPSAPLCNAILTRGLDGHLRTIYRTCILPQGHPIGHRAEDDPPD